MTATRKKPQDHPSPRTIRLGSVEEAAAESDVNPRTIRRRIADGTIPAWRVGRLIKVDLDGARTALLRPMNDAARRALATTTTLGLLTVGIAASLAPPPRRTTPRPDRIRQAEGREKSVLLQLAEAGEVAPLADALAFTGWSIGKRLRYARRLVNSDTRQRARLYRTLDAAASDTPFRTERTGDHYDAVPARASHNVAAVARD